MHKGIENFNWFCQLKDVHTDSIENDFILLDKPIISSSWKHPFKIDVITAVICMKGSIHGSINLKKYDAEAPCLFIILPDQILEYESFSDDFSGLFIVMTKQFANSLLMNIQEKVPFFIAVQENPWAPLNKEELETMVDYFYILQKIVRMKDNPHRREIVKHFIQAFFYSSSYQFHKFSDTTAKSKQEFLVNRFISCVQKNYRQERTQTFYADKLCLTSKYLSKVINEYTGSSATEWINNCVILEAKALLKSTNMTIQQISDELNFNSQSFFGKYFKRLVGLSPKQYRNGR